MEGEGQVETAQKERELYPPLLLSRASQVQSPSVTSHGAAANACCGYRRSWFRLGRERMGIESRNYRGLLRT